MKTHAYLILAHDQPVLLEKLIRALDDERNDIYLHLDSRAAQLDPERLLHVPERAGVYFAPRRSISWGGESLILAEMDLFRTAAVRQYRYYHLLSGTDFPLRSQDGIHAFFEAHEGQEFLDYWDRDEKEYLYRIRYRYPLQEQIGRYTNDSETLQLRLRSKAGVIAQKLRGEDRVRAYGKPVRCGSEWASLTNALVLYLLEREEEIREFFLQGVAADELYKQTLCWNSPFREKIHPGGAMRLIDWERGDPYIWQESDWEQIRKSDALFIRKVTEQNGLPDRLLKAVTG